MTFAPTHEPHPPVWEQDIRQREEALRLAFLAANVPALDELLAERFVVNSPLQSVLDKRHLLELLRAARIRHESYEVVIECVERHGNAVVVMGRDRVTDPPDGVLSHRRFTNVWSHEDGIWRTIARHAHVISREPAGA